jgi:cobalt/nickel transport system ATP-binding protein
MIELVSVSHAYPGSSAVLESVSFRVEVGERVVVLGANGSGKTTLLRILNGLVFPSEGEVLWEGAPLTRPRLRRRDVRRRFRREVALLFQDPAAMFFHPTVREEIAFGPLQAGTPDAASVAEEWARRVGVSALLDRAPYRLSAGEQKKVALATILAVEPRLVLLDEPTASLDPRSTGWLVDFLQDLDLTLVVTSHNLGLAAELGTRVIALSEDHRVIHDGDFDTLRAQRELLLAANLLHAHRHRHGAEEHRHYHAHEWD